MKNFSEWLKSERKRLNLTQVELADLTRLSPSTVQKIEQGQTRNPGRATRHLIETALDLRYKERHWKTSK